MTAYAIATLQIHDRERYGAYEAGFMQAFEGYGAKILCVNEAPQAVEGTWDFSRTVIIEFPDRETANRWYSSDAYQAIVGHRQAASDGSIVFLDGLAGAS